jgi:polyhydroxybutyrate depolymerase
VCSALQAAAVLLALCAAPASAQLAPGLHALSIDFGGLTRLYDVYVPARYDGATPAPLVLDFHGFTHDKDAQREKSGFDRTADTAGFLVAYPQGFGLLASWNTPTCCGEAQRLGLDDVGLAVAIVDAIAAATPIDRRRVFATGHSNGGALAHLLACRRADVFAAVAPVAFPLPVSPASDCQPSRGVPVLHFHGFSDPSIPFSTTSSIAPYSAPGSLVAWATIDQCTSAPNVFFRTGGSFCGGLTGCRDGAAALLCALRGDHALYENTDGVPIADVMWAVLSRYALPGP